MKIGLIGPGAIGLHYAGLLASAGAKLHILARSDYAALMLNGIQLVRVDAQQPNKLREQRCVQPAQISRLAHEIGPMDWVIVAAKSTYNRALLSDLRHLIQPRKTIILSLQNGMGNAEYFASHFPNNPIVCGLCFICVNRTAPGVVENYHPGQVEFGSFQDTWPSAVRTIITAFQLAGVKTILSQQLEASLWRKLCWNIPFNGLSIVAGGCTTDQILANPDVCARARILMQEVQAAASLAGHQISDDFLQQQFEITRGMGAYRPSSLIDFQAGRAVEIAAIWEIPLQRGEKLGAAMPELTQLVQELRDTCSQATGKT
jgi:2-dehydropantoate 2-reductase